MYLARGSGGLQRPWTQGQYLEKVCRNIHSSL